VAADVWHARNAQGLSVAERLMREWSLEPIAYEEQSRALLPTVRRSRTRRSSLTPLPGVAPDAIGFRGQAY
jgi:hypothetical protein